MCRKDDFERVEKIFKERDITLYLHSLFRKMLCLSPLIEKVNYTTVKEFFVDAKLVGKKCPVDENNFNKMIAETMVPADKKLAKDFKLPEKQRLYLERHHLWELLFRLSLEVCKDLKQPGSDLFKHFLKVHINPVFSEEEAAEDFMYIENEVYQGSINDLYFVNLSNLEKVYYQFKGNNPSKLFNESSLAKIIDQIYPDNDSLLTQLFKRCKMLPKDEKELASNP